MVTFTSSRIAVTTAELLDPCKRRLEVSHRKKPQMRRGLANESEHLAGGGVNLIFQPATEPSCLEEGSELIAATAWTTNTSRYKENKER